MPCRHCPIPLFVEFWLLSRKLKSFAYIFVHVVYHIRETFQVFLGQVAPTTSKKRGDVVRTEPKTLALVNSSPTIRVAFENAECIPFCQKVQKVGHRTRLASLFALNFTDDTVKLGYLEVVVTKKLFADATGLPKTSEKWFKGHDMDVSTFKEFVKPEFSNKFATTFPIVYI